MADDFYGAEQENETLFIWPIDVVCSQKLFAGGNAYSQSGAPDLTANTSEHYMNDFGVFTDSLPVDAGIVMLPKSARVDPNTGSIYKTQNLDGKVVPVFADGGRGDELVLAENTIPAQQFWEKYFSAHENSRPAHVVYYDGDPKTAVESLLAENGIKNVDELGNAFGPGLSADRDGKLLGFEENFAARFDPRIQRGHEQFDRMAAQEIIERYGLACTVDDVINPENRRYYDH